MVCCGTRLVLQGISSLHPYPLDINSSALEPDPAWNSRKGPALQDIHILSCAVIPVTEVKSQTCFLHRSHRVVQGGGR